MSKVSLCNRVSQLAQLRNTAHTTTHLLDFVQVAFTDVRVKVVVWVRESYSKTRECGQYSAVAPTVVSHISAKVILLNQYQIFFHND